MLHQGKMRAARLLIVLGLAGCGSDADAELLALPPIDRPSPEARLGLPEVEGSWTFVGWEIVEGDSTSLERTFPSFGALRFDTQRLDSIAGSFVLGGGPVAVVGDVRRDGKVTFVTLPGGSAGAYVAGSYVRDTLWLELTSILPRDEWPRDARAAFVREPTSEAPFAWLRGARVPDTPPSLPVDSLAADSSGFGSPPAGAAVSGSEQEPVTPQPTPLPPAGGQPPAVQPSAPAAQPGQQPSAPPAGPRPATPPPTNQPAPQPSAPQSPTPQPGPAPQPQPQPQPQPAPQPQPQPAPQPQPEPEPEAPPPAPAPVPPPPADPLPPLLGEPVNP